MNCSKLCDTDYNSKVLELYQVRIGTIFSLYLVQIHTILHSLFVVSNTISTGVD